MTNLFGSNYPYLEQNIHGPKGVRVIEVRLYLKIYQGDTEDT